MKSKQVLDVHQMQHLQELGLDTSNASMVWCKCDCEKEYSHLLPKDEDVFERCLAVKYIPAYTLQDVLDALPLQIEIPFHPERGKYELRIKRFIFDKRRVMHAVLYEKEDYIDWFVMQSYETLIDAAYEMLCWCVEKKFVETNKNE